MSIRVFIVTNKIYISYFSITDKSTCTRVSHRKNKFRISTSRRAQVSYNYITLYRLLRRVLNDSVMQQTEIKHCPYQEADQKDQQKRGLRIVPRPLGFIRIDDAAFVDIAVKTSISVIFFLISNWVRSALLGLLHFNHLVRVESCILHSSANRNQIKHSKIANTEWKSHRQLYTRSRSTIRELCFRRGDITDSQGMPLHSEGISHYKALCQILHATSSSEHKEMDTNE